MSMPFEIPLTPALSPSEGARENRSQSQRKSETDDRAVTIDKSGDIRWLFPLPRRGGVGQGEGASSDSEVTATETLR